MPGRTGRRSLPTRFKLLRGETRPSRLGKHDREPQPAVGRPRKPAYLAGHAASEWERLCRLLLPLRVLTVADAPILEATCLAYLDFREANEDLQLAGRYQSVATKSGGVMMRQHPALAIRSESWRRYVMGLTHFGLSPASRTKVHADTQGELDFGKLAKFTGQGGQG